MKKLLIITILIATLFISCDGFHQEIIPVNVLVDDVPSVLVINGEIEIGVLAEFIIYVNMLTWPVAVVGWITSIVQQAEASQKRINDFF